MVWKLEDPQGNEAAKVRFDVVPYFGSVNLDLGCGPSKVWPNFTGIDNGADVELFGVVMKPDVVVKTCERLPMYADGGVDCIFSSHLLEHVVDYKAALAEWWRLIKLDGHLCLYLPHRDLYPNIGQPGGNPDHKHDFLPQDIVDAMGEIASDWDCVVNETRDQLREYSFFLVFKKVGGVCCGESWKQPKPQKTAAVVRPGAYGDALWGGSLCAELKAQGYHVTFYTGPVGRQVMHSDPNIDRLIVMPNGLLDDEEMILYFLWESRKYSRFHNLIGAAEGRLLPHPNEISYYWPQHIRHAEMNFNYLERLHTLADLPHKFVQQFHPTAQEKEWAIKQRETLFPGRLVVICPCGSGGPKTWPHTQRMMDLLAERGVYSVVMGEIRQEITPHDKYGGVLGKELNSRAAMALAQTADAVIGTETGILNSVASMPMRKVVFLSHSSAENLTKHWVNTKAVEPAGIKCHPCHRLHRAFEFCTKDSVTGWAACQAAAHPELVLDAIADVITPAVIEKVA